MTRGILLFTGLWLAVGGCAESVPTEAALRTIEARAAFLAEQLSGEPVVGEDGVVVRLMFDKEVDLDLYVTDPLLETVYFARHESRTGGVIGADVRCESTGPRVEEIRFSEPWPGRYRVGVDFPRRCDDTRPRAPAPFAVSVRAEGVTYEAHGLVNLEYFEVVVLEFDVEKPGQLKGES